MKRAICLLFSLCIAASVAAETRERYLVGTRRPMRAAGVGMLRDANEMTARQVRTYGNFDVFGVDLTAQEAAELKRSGEVRHVNPVVVRHIWSEGSPSLTPTIAEKLVVQTIPYGIDRIRARDVWSAARGAAGGVNVVIVDTGIDYDHPDLKARYMGGYNVFEKDKPPFDDHSHGTHVAGTVAAIDNAFGVVGVAPEARIWSVKVLNGEGSGTDETIIAGLNWLISKKREVGGNWVANFSLGSGQTSLAEHDAFRRTMDEGIIVVAAAGNSSAQALSYPAAHQGVLAISAIDSNDALASFSNYGRGVAFAAPGVRVLSTVPVGSVDASEILLETKESLEAMTLIGSGRGEVTADMVFCGFGAPEDFPAQGIAGKIALIRRSPLGSTFYFRDKARNAAERGATAVVILPDERGVDRVFTLHVEDEDRNASFPIVVTVPSTAIADRLIGDAGKARITISNRGEDYTYFNGTSMSTPHVVGALALAWSLVPTATAEQVKTAAKLTAHDLGEPGYDNRFGYGRIDALAIAHYLAPGVFGVPPPTPLPYRRRPGS